jgi:hypothetical protein
MTESSGGSVKNLQSLFHQEVTMTTKKLSLMFAVFFILGLVLAGCSGASAEAARHYEAGVAFQNAGEWDKAAQEFEAVLKTGADRGCDELRQAADRASGVTGGSSGRR